MKRPPKRYFQKFLAYDPNNGNFYWKVMRSAAGGAVHAGDIAGTIDKSVGYRKIGLEGEEYFAHRLAWLFMTGRWPKRQIDHCNMNRSDNRWSNLREATKTDNMRNRREQNNNTSGMRGIYIQKNTFGVSFFTHIKVNRRRIVLGYFKTFNEAVTARLAAEKKYFGEFRPDRN